MATLLSVILATNMADSHQNTAENKQTADMNSSDSPYKSRNEEDDEVNVTFVSLSVN